MGEIVIHYPLGVPFFGEEGITSDSQTKQILSRTLNQSLGENGILETYTQTAFSDSFVFELTLKPQRTILDVQNLVAQITKHLPQITITTK